MLLWGIFRILRFLFLFGKGGNLRSAKSFVSWNNSALHSSCVIFGPWQLAGLLGVPGGRRGSCSAQRFQSSVGCIGLPALLPWPQHHQFLHLQPLSVSCSSCFLFPALAEALIAPVGFVRIFVSFRGGWRKRMRISEGSVSESWLKFKQTAGVVWQLLGLQLQPVLQQEPDVFWAHWHRGALSRFLQSKPRLVRLI